MECGHPGTAPGGPTGPQPGCDRRTLPDGSRVVSEQYFSPESGISSVWLSIKPPAGNQRFLVSSLADEGPPAAAPLTVEELISLVSEPRVINALDAVKDNQRW